MTRNLGDVAAVESFPARPRGEHLLGQDASMQATDCVCHAGVCSPLFEGAHPRAHISVLLAGTFHARSRQGAALVGPGALLLGNAFAPYEYRHVDDGGDRSIVFDYDEVLMDELGGSRGFSRLCIPSSPASAGAVMLAWQALWSGEAEALKEAALAVAEVALAADQGESGEDVRPSPRQVRRVARTLRYVEAHCADDCSLDALAAQAGLSRFHFLRVFRAMTGQTPRQFVIATRLRVAATALRATRKPITEVALDAGFGDLSHFTTSFTRAFGASPRAFRKRGAASPRALPRSFRLGS
ncbi:helix-turn-helix transcriptional regulator [Pyxidicoccus fallax]|uniref:Helix-turn-helix transcriptional regulator n=1 Tax=Pyxidicoccus fallax TaxID=394095 RepID=A0A848L3X6_9BACT|nr:AraC family transcriptional regulator [Pyxidicoccus fallax]NMO13650.1 helix-turn-helix transcriptional regulator [Pyxidicoccus fallax]NPC76862.1 helix-turn-helix transcriptional regulator [Pyxidicoccus fallax]